MKNLILAVLVLGFVGGVAAAQTPPVKKVEVSARSVSRLPARKSFTIDATRKDTVYTIAAGVNFNRVRVRTSKGYLSLAEILRKANRTPTGAIRIGFTNTIGTHGLGSQGTTNLVECSGLLCTCTGDVDCNDMFTNHGCGDIAGCDERGCWCLKL